jgi:hypothetical protein
MSKKLIAVASAAALALTALVGVAPANATAPSIALTATGSAGAGTSSSPYELDVPAGNIIDTSAETAITFTIGTSPALAIGDVITVTATGAVKLLETEVETASANFNASTLGKSSLAYTKTNDTAVVFFAYTTSTTAGTVKIDIARTGVSTSNTYHIEGVPGPKHTVANVTGLPTTLANTATATVNFTVNDVFGNVIENKESDISTGTERTGGFGFITWNASKKAYQSTLTSGSSSVFLASIDLKGSDVVGMPKASDVISAIVNNPAAATANAAATAQIAALTTQLAASRPIATSVTKKKYNTLARKWNAAFPSQKVALKK